MIKTRDHAAFRPWLAAARGSELGGFARALERDGAAVEAALTLPWSTGPAAWSAGLAPTRRIGAACARDGVGAGVPHATAGWSSAQRSQERTRRSARPSSAATCDTERPPQIAATASRLNASGKLRRLIVSSDIVTSRPFSLSEVSTKAGQAQ
jgi:hypothetical protein